MKIFNSEKIQLYKKALNAHTKTHEAIAKNVANAYDLNYKRINTDFSKELDVAVGQKLKQSDPRHMDLNRVTGNSLPKGDQKVDINREMSELAVNQIKFDFISSVLKKAYRGLNSSITGRTS